MRWTDSTFLVAPFNSHVRDLDPDFQSSQWLAKKSRIGVLVIDGPMVIETYLSEDAVKRIRLGSRRVFVADGMGGPILDVRVAYVDADASRVLPPANAQQPSRKSCTGAR